MSAVQGSAIGCIETTENDLFPLRRVSACCVVSSRNSDRWAGSATARSASDTRGACVIDAWFAVLAIE